MQQFTDLCSFFIYLFLYSGSRILFCHVFNVLSIHPKYLRFDDKPNAVELFSKNLPTLFVTYGLGIFPSRREMLTVLK